MIALKTKLKKTTRNQQDLLNNYAESENNV